MKYGLEVMDVILGLAILSIILGLTFIKIGDHRRIIYTPKVTDRKKKAFKELVYTALLCVGIIMMVFRLSIDVGQLFNY